MKKVFTLFLALLLLLPTVLSVDTVVSAEEAGITPFVGLGWSDLNRLKYPNLEGLRGTGITAENGVVKLGSGDQKKDAEAVKRQINAFPDGMRYMHVYAPAAAFGAAPENAVYLDNGVDQLKEQFSEFIKEYHAIGGKIDGIILDLEYVHMGSWYVYSEQYSKNTNIYNEIVANPKYATEIRPLLEERGFKFYENVGGVRSEIYGIFPHLTGSDAETYKECRSIWDTVMRIRLNQYLNESVLEPMQAYFPDATLCDYQSADSYAWQKELNSEGGAGYLGGNGMKAGNVSNDNVYSYVPSDRFYKVDGTMMFNKPFAYNKAVYEDDPYNMFLWDANRFKNMYAATDTKKISAWIANYDYNSEREGAASNTPYYTETILHIGLLNPQPFLVYMWDAEFTTKEYDERSAVISQILAELTRVVGASDRKPIETPAAWNDGYVLSGMYAGGRNVWRLTPDTTDGMTLENFKVKDKAPTFSINGKTIIFPQGRIIADGEVGVVGTCGYWIETPTNVTPVVLTDKNRYSENPSFLESFEGYEAGFQFKTTTSLPEQTWEVTASTPLQIENSGSKALALTGTAKLRHFNLPKNITAADSFAKQQMWEVSFTLTPEANNDGSLQLLGCRLDGGFKIEKGEVYYDKAGTYEKFSGVTLSAGQKYTAKRELNFTNENAFTSNYTICDASGNVVAQANNVPTTGFELPVLQICFSSENLAGKAFIDDYKLYPLGAAADMDVFDAKTGIIADGTKSNAGEIAYRVSWFNGSDTAKTVTVTAQYAGGETVVVRKVEAAPGCDGVELGTLENSNGVSVNLAVTLADSTAAETPLPDYDNGNFNWGTGDVAEPTTQPTTAPTTAPATAPTTAPTTAPNTAPTTVPTTAPTTAPTGATAATTAPTTAPTAAPTTTPTIAPTDSSTVAPTTPADDAGNSGTIVIIVVIVLVIAGAGVGVFFYLKKKKNPSAEAEK